MNILLVSTEFPPSARSAGIGSYTNDLAHGLSDLGHVVVVLTARSEQKHIKNEKFQVVEVDGVDFYIGRSFFAKVLNRLRAYLFYNIYRKRLAKKILQLHSSYKFDLVEIPEYGNEGKYWLRAKQLPTVIRFHGPSSLNRFKGLLEITNQRQIDEFESLKYGDAFSFVSKALKKVVLSNQSNKLKSIPSFVVHNNVIIPQSLSKNINNKRKKFVIVGAGSLGKIKGWDLLVDACEILNNLGIEVEVELYGRYADLEEYLKSKENSWLHVYGHIDRKQLFEKYKNANLCCFPSWFEPMGLTALEAMGCGGIVLASKFGGWSEVIEDGINGFLMNPEDGPGELSKKIQMIMNLDQNKNKNIRTSAENKVSSEYSPRNFLNETISVYKKAIQNWENHNDIPN